MEEDSVILRGHKFPRAWDRLVGLVHYLTRNDDVEPWECVYLPRSRRKSTDTRRWLPFSRPFEWNRNSSLTLASVDTQRSSEEERDGRVSVCMWERPSSTSGSNQMQVNPDCFSTFKGPPHIGEIDHSLTVRTFDFVVWNWIFENDSVDLLMIIYNYTTCNSNDLGLAVSAVVFLKIEIYFQMLLINWSYFINVSYQKLT